MSVSCDWEAASVWDCVVLDQHCRGFYHKLGSHNLNCKSLANGKSNAPIFIFDGDDGVMFLQWLHFSVMIIYISLSFSWSFSQSHLWCAFIQKTVMVEINWKIENPQLYWPQWRFCVILGAIRFGYYWLDILSRAICFHRKNCYLIANWWRKPGFGLAVSNAMNNDYRTVCLFKLSLFS